ncbi:uncharacterized protein TRIADDRAFT_62461 [Trichoplax adhaerens]|uniref:Uncharacterized protein n=1 Tax=Trichoplax adhaerens TaxID=10228 RepID=B3SDV5_TRIAD|nr:predicted protein [Trichoplax adhaerens]EDV19089.1 predicted protein [Trichoplax adhaerens]|eukprot:XP_002118424.1 predicted protein [Trichoplax adhaerens]
MEQDIEFENQFRPLHDIEDVENILVSGDQSMIAIDCFKKEVILKMSGGQVQSRVKLDQSGRSMFIPGSNRLLIYDARNVYEYNLQGDKIAWQDISQTKSVDVGRLQRNPQTTVNIFDLIEFVGIEDYGKYRELINGILEEESAAKDLILFRYRKKDKTLILMNTSYVGEKWIITVNLTTGKKSVNRLTLSHGARVVYVDDDYLYVWERNKDDRRSLKILNQDGMDLLMKRYKDNIKYFDNFTQFFNHENLWSDKQLILYEKYSSLNIYNPQTLQLQITLPFPHFDIWDMQWNLQHSQLIISSDQHDYCLVTHVKKT